MIIYKTHSDYTGTDEEHIAIWLTKKAIHNGECWECHLAPNAKGYSNVQVGGRQGTKWRAHRLIYTVIHGTIPLFGNILHTCDNRRCIRPKHLWCGSEADNTADMIAKGRGKTIPRTDHYNKDAILELHNKGLNRFEIAKQLRISPSTVWNYISPRGPYYGI